MLGWFRKRKALPEPSSPLGERVAQLESDLRALRRDVDDLDDSLRAFKGRVDKRAARERSSNEGDEAVGPGTDAAPVVGRGPAAASVHQLRAAGRWPFK